MGGVQYEIEAKGRAAKSAGFVVCFRGGDSFSAGSAIIVEGNLSVNTEKFTIRAPLFIKGDLNASGVVTVDIANPFEDALVVDGSIEVQNLNVVGKVRVGGDASVSGALDVTRSIAAVGNVSLSGKTRLTYLDTVYKAALFAAQQKFGDTLLVHSQVFRGLADGRNSVALFTFVKGYKQLDEETLLRKIRDNTINPSDYYSVVLGASADYGSTLVEFDVLAPYYADKVRVLDKLRELGHADIYVTKALSVGAENFYLTFSDGNGRIGTYLVNGDSSAGGGTEKDGIVELTDADRESIVKKIKEMESAASQASNAATANKARAAASGGTFPDGKSPEEFRTEEWRYLKGLEEVSEEVEIEVESEPARSVKYYGSNQTMERGFFKKLKKAIKRIVTIPKCESSTDLDFIAGVKEGDNDDWTKYIAVHNEKGSNSCAVASGTMVLRYHGRRKGITSFYEGDAVSSSGNGKKLRYYPVSYKGGIPLFDDLAAGMYYDKDDGTILWNAVHGINKALKKAGINETSESMTEFNPLEAPASLLGSDSDLYDRFYEQVRKNMPPIVNTWGEAGWPGDHFMPVLGTKKNRYNIWCTRANEHYLYVHTTWGAANVVKKKVEYWFGDKRYYRFDARAYPLAIWSGITINVN
ncbi:MAG: hypothetical protein HZA20_10335 [Nitrospirae bacterium]|nr:hypothetical protein [Nitrospirota bacterium]